MNRHSGKWSAPIDHDEGPRRDTDQPRRIGRVVHDDRGAASIEWQVAPEDHERQRFELENSPGSGRGDTRLRKGFELTLEVKKDASFNPYDRQGGTFNGRETDAPAKSGKRDLRKLSEWIKTMRAMEDRKKNGGGE